MLYLDIFDKEYLSRSPTSGILVPTDLNYLRRLYTTNRDMITEYYLSRNFATRNTHILSRFLEHIPPHFTYDDYRYLEYIDDKVTYLAKHFKFTSDIEKGIVHLPYFYGNQGEEIILNSYEPINVQEVKDNWTTVNCVTIIKHPRNDTRLLLPLGRNDGSRSGLSVVNVDLIKLAIKYREFMRVQYRNSLKEGATVYNKNFFIVKYVLAPMMSEHIDHLFLNKVMDRFYGREEVTPKFKHRFRILEPNVQIDRYVDQTLENLTNKKLDFPNVLKNISLIFTKDASELLALPDMVGTRQSRWALLISRLEHMCFIYDVASDKDRSKHHINDWKRLVKRIRNDRGLLGEFSYEEAVKIEDMLTKIEDM